MAERTGTRDPSKDRSRRGGGRRLKNGRKMRTRPRWPLDQTLRNSVPRRKRHLWCNCPISVQHRLRQCPMDCIHLLHASHNVLQSDSVVYVLRSVLAAGDKRASQRATMVCGGYTCTRNSLCALNILYVVVSLLLMGVAAWGKWFGLVSSIRVVAGVLGVGAFLFLVAFVGLCGALNHHQVFLFFYMIVLFMVFVVQFSVSCACLTINKEQQDRLLESGWNRSLNTQRDVEKTLNCCGYTHVDVNGTCAATCFHDSQHPCATCSVTIEKYAGAVLQFVGGVGLFFSFTEMLGVWLTHRYRNMKDPRSSPEAFL